MEIGAGSRRRLPSSGFQVLPHWQREIELRRMRKPDEFLPDRGEMAALMRSKDWRETPLGPMATWPSSLQTVLRLMLPSRYPIWLGWGDDLLFFYNDAYREQTRGAKHPASLARPSREVWAEIWDDLAPRMHRVVLTGEATWDSGLLLFLERNGYSEETYHTFSYSPAPADTGGVGGLFCVVIEETERVLADRRASLLRSKPELWPAACSATRPRRRRSLNA